MKTDALPAGAQTSPVEYRQFDFRTKVLHQGRQLKAYVAGERPVALNVEIDLTNACNHRCSFCQWGNYIQESRATLSADLVRRTLGELRAAGTRSINFTGGGEPTLHRDFHALLDCSFKLGLQNGLLTNGSLLPQEHDDQLLEQLVWMRVSMAGGAREPYRAVQGRDDFDTVVGNLRRIAARRKQTGATTGLGVAMLVKRDNLASVPGLARTLADMGLDYLQVRQDMFSDPAELAWWRGEAMPVMEGLRGVTEGSGLRILGARYVDAQADLGFARRCHAHHFVIAINAEGFVCFCKNTRDKPEFYVGNLHDRTFTEIWESSLRIHELEGSINPANCATFCKNMDINNAVESVVRGESHPFAEDAPPPVHKDFL
jgi:MoaA/NifB/PqqE/SkfB family radical SAM enzyme